MLATLLDLTGILEIWRSNCKRAAWLHYETGSSKLRIANADQKYQH